MSLDPAFFLICTVSLAIGTLLIRGSVIALAHKVTITPRLREMFTYIPVAVYPALFMPQVFLHQGSVTWLGGKERLLVLLLAIGVSYLLRNILVTVVFGLAVLYMLAGCSSVTPAQRARQLAVKGCDFKVGIAHGFDRIVYDNSCPADQEELYLVGYGIGRKIKWVYTDVDEQEKYLSCLVRLKDAGVGSPVSASITYGERRSDEVETPACGQKKLHWRTDASLAKEIVEEQKILIELKAKRTRLDDLRSKIAAQPDRVRELVKEYEAAGVDKLDVSLRWNKYILQQGGLDRLSMGEKVRMREELDTMQETLPANVSRGALIYGFGVGHARQGRFVSSGWIYTVIDTLLVGAIGYGAATNQPGIWASAAVLGLPLSHLGQYIDAYYFNLNNSDQMRNLRTQRFAPVTPFVITWQF